MKVNRILAAALIPLLLLTGCQTPPEDSPLPPDAPEETGMAEVSNESNPPPPGSGKSGRTCTGTRNWALRSSAPPGRWRKF